MWLGGRLGDRFPARGTAAALVLLAASSALPVAARTPGQLTFALLVWGACGELLNIAMNADVGRYETVTGRPFMQRAHAAYSAGLLAGSAATAGLLAAGAPYEAPIAVAALACCAAAGTNLRVVRGAEAGGTAPRSGAAHESRLPRLPATFGYVLVLGLAAALGRIVEADVQSWSSIHLHDTLHASGAVAAVGPAAFAASMVAMRLRADRLLGDVDRHRVLVGTGLVGACSTVAFAFAPTPAAALAALLVSGVCMSVVVPVLYSLTAAAAAGQGAGRAIARVSAVAWVASLGGPPAIGALADTFGLRAALGLAGLCGVGLAAAGAVAGRMAAGAARSRA
jgi:predicted MFS family arabinose efflux permease